MTVILSYRSTEFVFLAADSFRWDFVRKLNVGPVQKLRLIDANRAFAVGGTNIDRTKFAEQMVQAGLDGQKLTEAAVKIATPLFEEKVALMEQLGVLPHQLLESWYAECTPDSCSLTRQCLPIGTVELVDGMGAVGPNTEEVRKVAASKLNELKDKSGSVPLDQWAYGVIGDCAKLFPEAVGLPAIACIITRDGTQKLRDDLHPRKWTGVSKAFYRRVR